MTETSRPRTTLTFALTTLTALAILPTVAMPQAAGTVRADFPDRRWTPVTAADAALAGAGLATDPASSAYANPALALVGEGGLRVSGLVVNPNRDDLRATTVEFKDANGFVAIGEVAFRARVKGLGLTAYFSQPHYEHGETRFIGFNPALGGGGDPYVRENEFTSATRYAGLSAAARLGSGVIVGAGIDAALLEEKYFSTPTDPVSNPVADTLQVKRTGAGIGGTVGVAIPLAGKWTVGASARVAGKVSDGASSDEPPMVGLLGVKYGRSAGSQAFAGMRYLGARDVNLNESGEASSRADARSEFALGYAYLDPAGGYSFRAGGAISPRPSDAALRLTRFGIGLGAGGEGLRGTLAYGRESESRPGDRTSSRNVVVATVEITR